MFLEQDVFTELEVTRNS